MKHKQFKGYQVFFPATKLPITILAILLILASHNLVRAQFRENVANSPLNENVKRELYSYTPNGKAYYAISTEKIIIKFKPEISFQQQSQILKSVAFLKPLQSSMMLPSPKVTIGEIQGKNTNVAQIEEVLAQLNQHQDVMYANPFLIYEDGTSQGITDQLFVKLKNDADKTKLESDSRKYDFRLLSQHKYDKHIYFIEVNKSSQYNALQLANLLTESKNYVIAEPDFLLFLKRFTSNDTYLNYQWALKNTGSTIQYNGSPNADMKVFDAWGISTGNANTKVAIIDEGVDLTHPDLINNILGGYDATLQGSGGAPQNDDAHGTSCAGIVAANYNNNLGVAGVAPNAKIVPVRIAYGSGNSWITSNAWIGAGIDWAWDQGDADVLSNSWGGGASSSLVIDAINRATTQGRSNLGAPVLFSAGNSNASSAAYPSNLSNVISVIASSMCDQRKSPTSCDGEGFWGSNYGTGADIAAPGVKIYTTDISGPAGYRSGDYMDVFNGTSSACPNAAGVMALILSVNPSLTMTQARQILESSCDKAGGYVYNGGVSNQPNGTWSSDFGYGRVNALTAVQLANPSACTGAPTSVNTLASHNNFCTATNVTLSLTNVAAYTGLTYQWQISNDNISYNNISGATVNYHVANVSANTWFRCKIYCGDSSISAPLLVSYLNPLLTTFPHTESFATNTWPCGWTVQNVNGDFNTWNISSAAYRTFYYNPRYIKNTTQVANDWIFSLPLQLNAGTAYKVRFWYKASNATLPEQLEIKWGTTPNASGMTSPQIFVNTNITHTTYSLTTTSNIVPTTTGVYYVGFHVMSAANRGEINIDDITFDIVQTCPAPLLGGTVSGPSIIEAGNATLSLFTLSGNSGLDRQWQLSGNAGTSWTDIGSQIYQTCNTSIPTPGNYLLRVKSASTNCPDVYSNEFPVTVIPRVGDMFSNPIMASLPYGDYLYTTPSSGFTSTYIGTNAQPSNDVFFKFTTGPCADSIIVGTCGSSFDNYVHVLDASGTQFYSMDDGPLCGQQAVFTIAVTPNTTYYVVAEGYGTASGYLGLGIEERYNPTLLPSINASGPATFCDGSTVTLTASSGASYSWSTGSTTQSIVVSTSGTYSVSVTDANGCVKSSSIVITVNLNTIWYADTDNDGYGDINNTLLNCVQVSGYVSNNTDCNDNDNQIHTPLNYYVDTDGDGYGSTTSSLYCSSTAPLGYATNNTDCNDNDNLVHTALNYYVDADGDGYGSTASALLCASSAPLGYATNNTDCNDNDNLVHTALNYYVDADNDGYGSTTSTLLCSSSAPLGYATNNTDCNDNNININPGVIEICGNGIDDNCDGHIDLGCCNILLNYATTNSTCIDIADGAINLSVTNAVAPLVVNWSNGATSEDITNLLPAAYTVTVTDNNGCTSSLIIVVGNNNIIPASPNNMTGPSGACRNQIGVQFSVPMVPYATSYIWTLPTGATGSSTSNTITLNFSSTYNTGNICVRAVNACGQSALFCRSIIRYTSNPGTPGAITGFAAGVCPSTTQTYSIAALPNATSYIWTAPSNASITSGQGTTNVTVSFSANFGTSGTLSVRSSNCIGNSSNRNLSITRTPGTPASITGPNSVCNNQTAIAFSTTNNPVYSYTWTVPSGASITSGQGTNTILVNWGTVSGNVRVRADVSCASSSFRTKAVTSTTCGARVATSETEEEPVELYPNPVSDIAYFKFRADVANSYKIIVCDMHGKTYYSKEGISYEGQNTIELPLSHLSAGTYIVRFSDDKGRAYQIKLLKQ